MSTQQPRLTDTAVYLDGQYYQGVQFVNCTMIYSGGPLPVLIGNQFIGCTWRLEGPASTTLDYFRMLIAIGGKGLVEESLGISDG